MAQTESRAASGPADSSTSSRRRPLAETVAEEISKIILEGELKPGELINSMGFDEATREWLLSGTALEWLGMDKGAFA